MSFSRRKSERDLSSRRLYPTLNTGDDGLEDLWDKTLLCRKPAGTTTCLEHHQCEELGFDVSSDFLKEQMRQLERIEEQQVKVSMPSVETEPSSDPMVHQESYTVEDVGGNTLLDRRSSDDWMIRQNEELGFDVCDDFLERQMKILEELQQQQQFSMPNVETETWPTDLMMSRQASSTTSLETPPFLESEGEDFTRILSVVELINEQRGLFAKIQTDSQRNLDALDLRTTRERLVGSKTINARARAQKVSCQDLQLEREPCAVERATKKLLKKVASSKSLVNAKIVEDPSDDFVIHISNDKKLEFKGARHAYEAISEGTAISVSCTACQSVLQVPESSAAVYCILCHEITPTDLSRKLH